MIYKNAPLYRLFSSFRQGFLLLGRNSIFLLLSLLPCVLFDVKLITRWILTDYLNVVIRYGAMYICLFVTKRTIHSIGILSSACLGYLCKSSLIFPSTISGVIIFIHGAGCPLGHSVQCSLQGAHSI